MPRRSVSQGSARVIDQEGLLGGALVGTPEMSRRALLPSRNLDS